MNEVRRFIANCITVFVKNKRVSKNIKCLIKYGKAEKTGSLNTDWLLWQL